MNWLTISEICNSKDNTIRFLQDNGILHRERICPRGHAMKLCLGLKEDRWRCRKKGCNTQIQLKTGTWLEGCHVDYRRIILFIYAWSQEYTSIKFSSRELGLSKATIIDYNNYLREVCAAALLDNPIMIGGPNCTVEIDESLFCKRKNHVGRSITSQWVFGGICRETKECFLYAVDDRSANTLIPIIQICIRPGTTIISDLWSAYNQIANLPQGYTHLTVNHSENFVDPITAAHTQNIEGTWNHAKIRNRKHFGTARGMLDSYLCEFMWRKRLGKRDAFQAILNDIASYWPPNH